MEQSRQLRDEPAAKAGTPDELRNKNLEVSAGDVGLTLAAAVPTVAGKGIKEIGLGDVVRAVRAVPDMSLMLRLNQKRTLILIRSLLCKWGCQQKM